MIPVSKAALPVALALAAAVPLRAQTSDSLSRDIAAATDRLPLPPAVGHFDRVAIVGAPGAWWDQLPGSVAGGLAALRCDGVSDRTKSALAQHVREELGTTVAASARTVGLQVSSLAPSNDACAMQGRFTPALVAAGISLAPADAYFAALDPDSIIVRVNGRRLTPVATARRPILTPRTGAPAHAHLVRVSLAEEAFDADSLGRLPAMTVEVFFGDGNWRSYDLDDAWVGQQWSGIAWSRARSLAAPPASLPRPRVPESSDAELRRADERFAQGDVRGATAILVARLSAAENTGSTTALSADDRLHANTLVASAFAAGGDSSSWRPFVRDAHRDAPCLGFGPSVPAGPRRLADALRAPATECAPRTSDAGRIGSWLPGRADVQAGRRSLGRTVALASLGLFGGSLASAMRGSSQHASYEAARDAATATAALQQANASRQRSGQLLAGGVALWLGDVLVGRLRDRAHDADVARVTGYGR